MVVVGLFDRMRSGHGEKVAESATSAVVGGISEVLGRHEFCDLPARLFAGERRRGREKMIVGALETRVSHLEGRVAEDDQVLNDVRNALTALELRTDRRFDAVDRRFDAVDRRFDHVDRRFTELGQAIGALDAKMSRQFTFLVGLMVTTLTGIVVAILTR
jgi:hypothetical protein